MAAEGGSIRLVMDGEALARLRGGETADGAMGADGGFDSKIPPLIGSYRWPELAGLGVEGEAVMWVRFGLLCMVSGLAIT